MMNENKTIEDGLVGLSDHNKIIYIVSNCCQVSIESLKAPNKGKREVCDARHIAVYIMRYGAKYTFAKMSAVLKRNTNALHNSLKVFPLLCESDKEFFNRFDRCNEAVKKYLN